MRSLTLILGRHAHSVSLIVFLPPSKSLKVFFFLPFYSLIKSPNTPATHPASGSRNSQSGRQHVPIQTHTAIHKSANNSQPIRHTDTPPPIPSPQPPSPQNKRGFWGSTHSKHLHMESEPPGPAAPFCPALAGPPTQCNRAGTEKKGSVWAEALDPPSPALFSPVTSSISCVRLSEGLVRPAPYCADTTTINWCPFTVRVAVLCCIQNVHKSDALMLKSLSLGFF